ncbi:MAG: TrbG/VirB9 family P-type conjugative transfer protein, partial [Burkholderiaceae bacterium]
MSRPRSVLLTAAVTAGAATLVPRITCAQTTDPRLREVQYDAHVVVTVPVKRGVVTHVVLGADEAITEVGAGLGGDCSKADSVWCIAAQPGGHHVFVKPKSGANAPNNLAVVTDRRTHSFRFVVLSEGDPRPPVYRLVVKPPAIAAARPAPADPLPAAALLLPPVTVQTAPPAPAPATVVAERLTAAPHVVNTAYSIAEGKGSEDIVPALVFDDGRFTYFRFPGNREVPAVFHVLGDGSESLVNTRMEGDLLVVDRVSRR